MLLEQKDIAHAWHRNSTYVGMICGNLISGSDSINQVFSSSTELDYELTMTMLTAVEEFSKILHNFPVDQSAAYGLAFSASKVSKYEFAAAAFESLARGRANILFPYEVMALKQIGGVNELYLEDRTTMAQQLARFGWQYLVTGRRDDAVVIYELATHVDPDNLEIWLDRIEIYANEWDKALDAYEHASLFFPDDPFMLMAGAYVNLNRPGNYDTGISLLNRAIPMLENVDISKLSRTQSTWLYYSYVMSAEVAVRDGNIDQARNWLNQAVELASTSIAPYLAQERLIELENSR